MKLHSFANNAPIKKWQGFDLVFKKKYSEFEDKNQENLILQAEKGQFLQKSEQSY